MTDYKTLVELLADSRSEESVGNSTIEHAQILVSNLVRTAEREVVIICGKEDAPVFGAPSVFSEMFGFLRRGGTLNLMLDTSRQAIDATGDGAVAQPVDDRYAGAWEVITTNLADSVQGQPGTFASSEVDASRCPIHFLVADNRAYRVEPEKRKIAAVACFNDPVIANELRLTGRQLINIH
jgi:hypothetical protein